MEREKIEQEEEEDRRKKTPPLILSFSNLSSLRLRASAVPTSPSATGALSGPTPFSLASPRYGSTATVAPNRADGGFEVVIEDQPDPSNAYRSRSDKPRVPSAIWPPTRTTLPSKDTSVAS